jgi:hypothetical protein
MIHPYYEFLGGCVTPVNSCTFVNLQNLLPHTVTKMLLTPLFQQVKLAPVLIGCTALKRLVSKAVVGK